jgi:hypothetical protein
MTNEGRTYDFQTRYSKNTTKKSHHVLQPPLYENTAANLSEEGIWQELLHNKYLKDKTLSQVEVKPTYSPFWERPNAL